MILTAINIVSLFDRVQIAALAQPIKQEFGFSDTQIGMLTGTAFGLTYALASLPLAWLSDRSGRARLLTLALLFWSVMTGLTGLARSFWHLFAARVGVAAGEAAFTPTAHSLLAEYFPPKRRAFAIGIENSGVSIGMMAGLATAGWVGAHYGWRTALFVACVPGILLAVVSAIWLRDPTSRLRADAQVDRANDPIGTGGIFARVGPAYGWLVVAAVCHSILTTGWTQWLPAFFMRSHGFSLAEAGASVGVVTGIGLTFGSIVGGWLSVRIAGGGPVRSYQIAALISLAVIPVGSIALWSQAPGISLTCVVLSTLSAGMLGPFVFGGIQNGCDPQFRARATALALTFVTLGSYALMPVAVGALSDLFRSELGDQSLRGALTALMGVPLIASFAFWRIAVSRTRVA